MRWSTPKLLREVQFRFNCIGEKVLEDVFRFYKILLIVNYFDIK